MCTIIKFLEHKQELSTFWFSLIWFQCEP